MVYAEFGGQTECIMGNWKIETSQSYELKLASVRPAPLFSSLFPKRYR